MNMSDRELFELAAKAAGYVLTDGSQGYRMFRCKGGVEWNPLTDDGDALRLAVNLSLDVDIDYDGCVIHAPDLEGWISEIAKDGDVLAATRRAIVRAAAEIGRAMG